MAPIATNATGVCVCVCVIYSTARLLAVNTSNPGSFTACGLTAMGRILAYSTTVLLQRRARTCVVLARNLRDVPDNAVDRTVEAVIIHGS